MKSRLTTVLSLLTLFLLPFVSLATEQNQNQAQYLIVIPVISGSFDGKTLTMKTTPQVIYFSDRPKHVAGHVRITKFIKEWYHNTNKGSHNATISIFSKDTVNNIVLELSSPKYVNNSVIFTVTILSGTLPTSFNEASVFIDNFRVVGGALIKANHSFYQSWKS